AHLRLPYVNIFMFQCQLSFSFRLPRSALLHRRLVLYYTSKAKSSTPFYTDIQFNIFMLF
ncbi:hypothetical protein, partial [Bacillus pretiosus]|uniref:hypothetical protein n=1 Tax=Bacillus pretiosus TaxID=2983392 RepID=UPI003D659BFF